MALNVAGMKFGRLTAIERAGSDKLGIKWHCICDCGGAVIAYGHAMKSQAVRSCGCLIREAAGRMGAANKRHGMTRTTEYNIWLSMRARCNNQKAINYRLYGARGIKVCERWENSFDDFFADMGPRPEGKSLDRIDGTRGYSPDNCRWATLSEQRRNRVPAAHWQAIEYVEAV